jgi:branched-chain amino acid transport system ATP-binding protein
MSQTLIVNNITKKFGGMVALKDVSFELEQGEIFGLIGPNGAGKTTLFNIISGLLKQTAGEVIYQGKSIPRMAPFRRCRIGIGRTFQVVKPFSTMTVRENVAVSAMAIGKRKSEALEKADEIITMLGIEDKADRLPGELTLSDKKRIEVSRALVSEPKLLLLDEVMAGLNTREMLDFTEIIRSISKSGVTIIMVEHVMPAILALCDRVLVLNFGQVLTIGTPQEIINNQKVLEAYLGEGYHAQN